MPYYRKKRLTNAAKVMMFRDYADRREAREEARWKEKSEYEKNNTYLFIPFENKKTYFSFILMKNGNAKITDIHGDASNVEIPEFIISSDTVSKKFDEQKDFSSKFPIKITVLGKIEVANLRTIILPNTIGKIFEDTFRGNESLEYVQFPKFLKEIGDYAFSGCTNLVKVNIPFSVTKIGDNAFAYCTALKSIKFSKRTESYGTCFLCGTGIEIFSIPINITSVNSAFDGMENLKRLYIHEYVSEITASFYSVNLSKIVVDESNVFFDSRQECNAIIDSKTNELLLGCKTTRLTSDVKIKNLNVFSSYPEYLIITEDNLFSNSISPIQKFITLNNYPYLFFTYEKSIANDNIDWYSINFKDFINDWIKHNQEEYQFSNTISDKCLIDDHLYEPIFDEIKKVDKLSYRFGNFIYFHYPFAFYKNDWRYDIENNKPKLVISSDGDYIFGYYKDFINREALVQKCDEIFSNNLKRYHLNKINYKKDYIRRYGIYEYKKNSISDNFRELFIEDPHKKGYSYYVDNTWVSWTEIRGSEYNEICKWNNETLEWEYDCERIW